MKKFYAIGEVSKIMGVSVQALRYYAKINLLEPEYISPRTGYRYYTYEQFHFIDCIKYLQKFGFSLDEIRTILLRNDIDKLVTMLDQKKEDFQKQIRQLHDTIDMITWYHDYFIRSQKENKSHISHFPKRYLVVVKIKEGETKESYHIRLHKIKNSSELKNEVYKRQFSLILSYTDFLEGKNNPTHIGMFLNNKPEKASRHVIEIPEGDYFCMTSHILCEQCNPYEAKIYFRHLHCKPKLVLANEYENSLCEYTHCHYEIQILIPPGIEHPTTI